MVTISHALNHGYNSLLPILYPVLISEFNLTYGSIGLISMGYQLFSGLLQIIMGFLGRYYRRKFLLGFGLIWQAIANSFMVLSQNFTQFFTSRSLAGIGSSPQHPTGSSYITDKFSKNQVGKALGIHIGFSSFGTFITPFLGSLLVLTIGWRSTALMYSIPGFIVGIAFLFISEKKRSDKWSGLSSFKIMLTGISNVLKNKAIIIVMIVELVMAFRMGINDFLPSFFIKTGLNSLEAGLLFTIFLGVGLPSPYIWGYLSDKFERRKVVMLAMSVASVMWFLLPYSKDYFGLLLVLMPLGFVSQGVGGVIQAYVAEITLPENRDIIFGIYFTLAFTIGSFSPVILGYLADLIGFQASFAYVGIVSFLAVISTYFMK